MKVLEGLLYTKDHEWVKKEGEKAYVGITDYAQNALGAIVYVELPEVGSEFAAGDSFAVVESVKAASDVYLPVAGTIIETNEAIVDEPGLVNEDPFDAWMVCVQLEDGEKLEDLMSPEEYTKFCTEER
ncbi:glycine cleavage system protein GcvH [Clostridium thermarum]|uniref:glycine cleavage system protein GcvH n=1 Tax=Clostridium thermarum TaxID=1716543 RepID=UPI0013D123F7|nr:glycine cleavage system protein GcvH [Clostridium thermarum]